MNQTAELLVNLFNEYGYNGIAEAIKNDDKPKDNALYGLNMIYKDLTSNRYYLDGTMKEAPRERVEKANILVRQMKFIIDRDL